MPLILVIEQEQRYVERIEEALSPQGWEVVGVRDQASAMRLVADRAADLVVLNAQVEDASAMVEEFSRANGGPGAVVLLPESGDNGVAQRGADEVLQKPFTDRDIRLAVRRCLSASRQKPEEVIEDVPSDSERLSSEELFGDVVLELEGVFNQAGGVAAEAETEVSAEAVEAEPPPAVVEEAARELDRPVAEEIDTVLEDTLTPPSSAKALDVSMTAEADQETLGEIPAVEEEPAEEFVVAAADEVGERLPQEAARAEEGAEELAAEVLEDVGVEDLEEEFEVDLEALGGEIEVEEAAEEVVAEALVEEAVEEDIVEEVAEDAFVEEPVVEDFVFEEAVEEAAEDAVEEPPVVKKRDEKQFLEQRLQEAVQAGKAAAAAKIEPDAEDLDSVRTADLLLQKALATVVTGSPKRAKIDEEFAEPAHATDEEVDKLVSTVVPRPTSEGSDSRDGVLEAGPGLEEDEDSPALEVVESGVPDRDEGEYRARMKLVWAIILIALLALLAFVITRPLGEDTTPDPAPIGASPSNDAVEPSRPAGAEDPSSEEGGETGAAGEGVEATDAAPAGASAEETGVDREARLRQELEAERRQLRDEIERTKADRQRSDSKEDGGGVEGAGALI